MTQVPNIDGKLVTWGDRLFYRSNRVVGGKPQPMPTGSATHQRAAQLQQLPARLG
jgi:ribosomal protein L44E